MYTQGLMMHFTSLFTVKQQHKMFNVTKEGQMKAFNYIFAEIG